MQTRVGQLRNSSPTLFVGLEQFSLTAGERSRGDIEGINLETTAVERDFPSSPLCGAQLESADSISRDLLMNRLNVVSEHRALLRRVTVLFLALLFSGCAVLNWDNRPVTEFIDRHLAPESDAGRAALTPVAVPIGLSTLLVDATVVNPVQQLSEARELAEWPFTEVEDAGVFEVVLMPMRVLTAAVMFVGAEVVLSIVPVEESPRRDGELEEEGAHPEADDAEESANAS